MPLPFILGAAALAAAGVGVKKGLDASEKNKQAKEKIAQTNRLIETTKDSAEKAESQCKTALEQFGQMKLNAMQELDRFIKVFKQIHNVETSQSNGLDNLNGITISDNELKEMQQMGNLAVEFASGALMGSAAGGLIALGAYGGAMTFAAASTGTAIASLSGAAATNATLAFFGGGSLAAGGLGMAGGAAVLGGLVAGPALAVIGFTMNAKAEKNLEEARAKYAQAKRDCEAVQIGIDKCNQVTKYTDMYIDLLNKLNTMFSAVINQLESIISSSGNDFRRYSEAEKQSVAISMAIAKAVTSVVKVSILTKENTLDNDAVTMLPNHQKELDDFRATDI